MTPSKITALIVDDEPLARRKLRELLHGVEWVECVGEVADGRAAVRAIDELQPDLVLLDIQMPGLSGLQVLERVSHKPAVIFTTAHDRYAVTAFELAAADYLLKPFGRERFLAALARARPALEQRAGGAGLERAREALAPAAAVARLFVREAGRVVPIKVADIVRLEAQDDVVVVHVGARRHLVNVPLQDVEVRLDPAVFLRVHRSHVVNLDHVRAFAPYDGSRLVVELDDGTRIVASRQRSRELRHLIV